MKYEAHVIVQILAGVTVEVEADSEEEANQKATEAAKKVDPHECYFDSIDNVVEIEDIFEIEEAEDSQ